MGAISDLSSSSFTTTLPGLRDDDDDAPGGGGVGIDGEDTGGRSNIFSIAVTNCKS